MHENSEKLFYTALDSVYNRSSLTSVLDTEEKSERFNHKFNGEMFLGGICDYEELAKNVRLKEAPAVDAFRFATYASAAGTNSVTADYTDGNEVFNDLKVAAEAMEKAGVAVEDRYLFITHTLNGRINDAEIDSKEIKSLFGHTVLVPQTRFYTAIDQKPDGYTMADNGAEINFIVMDKNAVVQYQSHSEVKIMSWDEEKNVYPIHFQADGFLDIPDAKAAGIYVSHK